MKSDQWHSDGVIDVPGRQTYGAPDDQGEKILTNDKATEGPKATTDPEKWYSQQSILKRVNALRHLKGMPKFDQLRLGTMIKIVATDVRF